MCHERACVGPGRFGAIWLGSSLVILATACSESKPRDASPSGGELDARAGGSVGGVAGMADDTGSDGSGGLGDLGDATGGVGSGGSGGAVEDGGSGGVAGGSFLSSGGMAGNSSVGGTTGGGGGASSSGSPSGQLYVINAGSNHDNAILRFVNPATVNGNVAPAAKISGPISTLHCAHFGYLDVPRDRMYVADPCPPVDGNSHPSKSDGRRVFAG
jgi:hypothetical protein